MFWFQIVFLFSDYFVMFFWISSWFGIAEVVICFAVLQLFSIFTILLLRKK